MIEKTVYIGKQDFYDVIRSNGGIWTDSKERPILCVTKSLEHDSLYWAIPMGDLSHRKNEAQQRIHVYLAKDSTNIESCYYHLGTTNKQSLFFISDIVPITDKYIERAYTSFGSPVIIKNKQVTVEIERKVGRILAYEKANPNYFRQHITDLKKFLLSELI
ncbi:MAG: hypothetical protein JJE49_07965 [Peptostreptococcaceae bacterium]|nr:hypothetical protein [Peptostreptococcaceae bacterium]